MVDRKVELFLRRNGSFSHYLSQRIACLIKHQPAELRKLVQRSAFMKRRKALETCVAEILYQFTSSPRTSHWVESIYRDGRVGKPDVKAECIDCGSILARAICLRKNTSGVLVAYLNEKASMVKVSTSEHLRGY